MLKVALVIAVGDDGVHPKSSPTFSFFSHATRMCNKLLLPTVLNFRIFGHINLLIFFRPFFYALQRALTHCNAR